MKVNSPEAVRSGGATMLVAGPVAFLATMLCVATMRGKASGMSFFEFEEVEIEQVPN